MEVKWTPLDICTMTKAIERAVVPDIPAIIPSARWVLYRHFFFLYNIEIRIPLNKERNAVLIKTAWALQRISYAMFAPELVLY